jgi:uncharacterized protein (DUF2267 family)
LFRALRGVLSLTGPDGESRLKAVFAQMPTEVRKKWVSGLKSAGNDNLKSKDSELFEGTWMDDPNQEPDWTIQNSIDFINAVDSEGSPKP